MEGSIAESKPPGPGGGPQGDSVIAHPGEAPDAAPARGGAGRGDDRPVRILVVSPLPLTVAAVREALANATLAKAYRVDAAESASELFRRVAEEPPDIVVWDARRATDEALAFVTTFRRQGNGSPVILLAGGDADADALAARVLHQGTVACLPAEPISTRALVSSIRSAMNLRRNPASRRGAEEALRRAETQLREVVRHAGIMICTHDLAGRIGSIDDAASAALGYAPGELVGTSIRDLLEPGHRPDFARYLEEIGRVGTATGFMAIVTRGGETRYWNYQNRLAEDGTIVRGTAIDVTDRIRAEAQSALSIQRQSAILDALPANVALLDTKGTILTVNSAWRRFAEENGADPATVGEGVDYLAACDRADAPGPGPSAARAIREVLAGTRERYDVEYPCDAPGKERWFRMTVTPVRSGGIRGAVVMHMDRTEQRIAEEQRRRQALIFENMYDAVSIGNRDNRVVDWNPGAERMFGVPRETALGQPIDLMAPTPAEKQVTANVTEIALREGRWSGLRPYRRPDGSPGTRELVVVALRDASNEIVGTAGISRDVTDRRAAEEALRESEMRYRFLFESNPLPMWVYDPDTLKFVDVNNAAIAHYGYSREEFLSMSLLDIRPPEDREGFDREVAATARTPQKFRPARHLRKDGAVRFVEVSAVDLPGGPARRRMALARDVTEMIAAEQALQASEEKYRTIFDLAPVGIYQTRAGGDLVACNDAFARTFGYEDSRELLAVGNTKAIFGSAEAREAAIAPIVAAGGASNLEMLLRRKDGTPVWVQNTVRVVRDAAGSVDRFEGFVIDITERKRMDEQRARLQTRVLASASEWRDTFDAIETPLVIVDSRRIIKRLNRAAVQLAGRTYHDVIGTPIERLAAPTQLWRTAARLVDDIVARGSIPAVLSRDERARRTWELSVSRFAHPPSDEPPGEDLYILVARDITTLVELQESLMKSESMSAMGALVAGVAHEVRNPLFAISATLDAFDLRFQDAEDHRKYAQALRAQVERMSNLMHDLLDFGKPVAYEIRAAPLSEILDEAIRASAEIAQRRNVTVACSGAEDLPDAIVDRARTVQVFVNLIENAIQHCPPGGAVAIRAVARDHAIECAVEDDGTGFRMEDLGRVFEPFFTRRQGGTGLGLAIVRRIVTEQGGSVVASNRSGGGARVAVTLPAASAVADPGGKPR